MMKNKAYTSPMASVTEIVSKDIITLSKIDGLREDGTYVGEHSAFWGE